MSTTIDGKTILVTGANRGIGQALVTEALRRGAARVYAGTRQPYAHPDPRVTVLPLDITDDSKLKAGANYFPNESDNFFVGNSFPSCGINFDAREIMTQSEKND